MIPVLVILVIGTSSLWAQSQGRGSVASTYYLGPWAQLRGSVGPAYLGNNLLPGLLQTSGGQDEGYLFMIGGPLAWGGQYPLYDYLSSANPAGRDWERGVGEAASTVGFSTIGYSYFAWERKTTNRLLAAADQRPVESYGELLTAPY